MDISLKSDDFGLSAVSRFAPARLVSGASAGAGATSCSLLPGRSAETHGFLVGGYTNLWNIYGISNGDIYMGYLNGFL